jgi:hypothetical protein
MDSTNVALYGIAKYIGYSLWCVYGIKLASGKINVAKGFLLGAGRWILGLLFGIAIFIFIPVDLENVYAMYFTIYIPVRIIEWWIMSKFLPGGLKSLSKPYLIWILGGVAVSFLLDLVSPEWIEEGRFCIGRCLC